MIYLWQNWGFKTGLGGGNCPHFPTWLGRHYGCIKPPPPTLHYPPDSTKLLQISAVCCRPIFSFENFSLRWKWNMILLFFDLFLHLSLYVWTQITTHACTLQTIPTPILLLLLLSSLDKVPRLISIISEMHKIILFVTVSSKHYILHRVVYQLLNKNLKWSQSVYYNQRCYTP